MLRAWLDPQLEQKSGTPDSSPVRSAAAVRGEGKLGSSRLSRRVAAVEHDG